jgi:hypothetical protein
MEIIKEYRDGKIISDKVEKVTVDALNKMIYDSEILSFQIVKKDNIAKDSNVTKNVTLKNRVSSIKLKDIVESKKREQAERKFVRITRKERCAKRNATLSESDMVTLSGCSLNAQRIFWEIFDSEIFITRKHLCEKFHMIPMTASRVIKELVECRLIIRHGSKKAGHYEISEKIRMRKDDE